MVPALLDSTIRPHIEFIPNEGLELNLAKPLSERIELTNPEHGVFMIDHRIRVSFARTLDSATQALSYWRQRGLVSLIATIAGGILAALGVALLPSSAATGWFVTAIGAIGAAYFLPVRAHREVAFWNNQIQAITAKDALPHRIARARTELFTNKDKLNKYGGLAFLRRIITPMEWHFLHPSDPANGTMRMVSPGMMTVEGLLDKLLA